MYQYSMTQWIVGNEEMEKSFIRLKKYGYDGIEFAAEPYTLDPENLKELLVKYQMVCTSLCGIYSEERDLSAPEGEAAKKAVGYLKDSIDLAAEVGAGCLIVVPSPVGRTAPVQGRSYQQAWENAVKNVRAAAGYAREKGIQLVIEAINRYETYLVNTIPKAVAFVREVNHPSVGVMADLFHMSLEENNLGQSLHLAAPYLGHVHIADHTREAAGLGRTDFKEVLCILKQIGYEGALTMEFMPRVANPYEIGDMDTQSRRMDLYAEQSIRYLKDMEKAVELVDELR